MSTTHHNGDKPSPDIQGEKAANGAQSPPTLNASTPRKSFLDRLPPWVTTNLRSSRSRKIWLRCWLASWVAFLLMLPNASLRVLGNAAFFGFLASFMIPANMPVQLFLFALMTMVAGICLGWGIGAAAMRAALASRNQLLLKQSLEREAQSAAGLANPDALFMSDIFQGKFLDTASSIVFAVFLGFGCFIFALIRAYAPKLMLMSVFGTVALDIYCSYGALFPFGQYTLLNSLLTAIGYYVAIGIVIISFIFPETVNHATLVSASGLVGKLKDVVDTQQQILNASPDDLADGAPLASKMQGLRIAIFGQLQQLITSSKLIGAEFSWGKWNAEDVTSLQEPLTIVVNRAGAFHMFVRFAGHRTARSPDEPPSAQASSASDSSDDTPYVGDTALLRQLREQHRVAESTYSVRMKDVLPNIEDATADLRAACSNGLGATKALLDGINMRRYSRKGARESDQQLADLDAALERLRASLAEFKSSRRMQLLQPYEPVFEDLKTKKGPVPFRGLYVSFVFAANLIVLSDSIIHLMELVQTTAGKRKKNRLWAPGGLRAIGKALLSRGDVSDQAAGEDETPPAEEEVTREERPYKLDPDSRPPTNFFQRVANFVHYGYKWAKTPEALFCFRYVILSVALYIPSVVRRSAHFIYVEKGLWSLIMAQTTLNVFASDQIYNYFTRILGTFVGAVLGLLGWYLGNAKSNGSPYGSATVVAVFLVPLLFVRLFVPLQYLAGVLLGCATFVLVMGYSWVDAHLPLVGSPGIGWPIAWKRFVTVIIGCAASFVIMMFPPKSGRKAVRLRNASTIASMSFIYSDIMAAWISSAAASPKAQAHGIADLLPGMREKFLALATQLQAVKVQTGIAKWEGSIRGAWPGDEYLKIADVQMGMMSSLALLAGSLSQVDGEMRVAFLHRTMVVNPNFIADVMATFSLVSQALRTGEPLPQAFHQNLLDRLHYHGAVGRTTFAGDGQGADGSAQSYMEHVARYEFIFYATAICAVFQVIEGLTELRTITARLCGEVPLEGFARWREDYDRAHVMKS